MSILYFIPLISLLFIFIANKTPNSKWTFVLGSIGVYSLLVSIILIIGGW